MYQDSQKEDGMLLCVNHGIFYEFIPSDEFLIKAGKFLCGSGVGNKLCYSLKHKRRFVGL